MFVLLKSFYFITIEARFCIPFLIQFLCSKTFEFWWQDQEGRVVSDLAMNVEGEFVCVICGKEEADKNGLNQVDRFWNPQEE